MSGSLLQRYFRTNLEAVDPNTIEGVDIRVGLAYYFMKLDL